MARVRDNCGGRFCVSDSFPLLHVLVHVFIRLPLPTITIRSVIITG